MKTTEMDTSMATAGLAAPELRKRSRIAGCWYLLQAVTGPFYLLYIPSRLIVPGDAATTIANIAAAETLFRLGIVSAFICQVSLILTGIAFYAFLKPVDKGQARTMVAFVVAAVPISFLNTLFQIGALLLTSGADYLKAFEPVQLQALAMAFLDMHAQGIYIASVFWGLWLLPLGILVLKSGFFPKVFGVFLVIGFWGYVVDCLMVFLFPGYRAMLSTVTSVAMTISEIPFLLWLLIVGARAKAPRQTAPAGA